MKTFIILLFIGLIFGCSNKFVFKQDEQKDEDLFWIDFRAGFELDTINLSINENKLLSSKVISTGNDGSYFTGLRIIYRENKVKGSFQIGNRIFQSNKELVFSDSLDFGITINSQYYFIRKSLDSCKTFSISYDKNLHVPIIDKYNFFLIYE